MTMRTGAGALIVGAVVVAVGVAAYVVRDFVDETIVTPIYVSLQLIVLYIRSIPQDAVWVGLVGTAVFIAYRSIRAGQSRSRRPARRTGDERPSAEQLILRWTIGARRNSYFHERLATSLAQHLCRAVGVAPGRASATEGLEAMLENRGVAVPEYIRMYLPGDRSRRLRMGRFAFRKRAIEADMQRLEDAVAEVERMAGVHEGRNKERRDG